MGGDAGPDALDGFARWAVEATRRPVPLHAVRVLKDWVAVTIDGSHAAPVRALVDALVVDDHGPCRLFGDGRSVDPRTSALVHAAAAHSTDLDDLYRDGLYHPGAPTIAAAWAVAQARSWTGEDLLRAIQIGYQVGNAIARAAQPAHYARWFTTGTVGSIGAAAAAATLLGLEHEPMHHALAIGTALGGGFQQTLRTENTAKYLHAGRAAEAGVLAAFAAERGATGPRGILDGPLGWGTLLSDGPDWDAAVDTLDTDTLAAMTFKLRPCCAHCYPAVDAARQARQWLLEQRGPNALDDLESVTVDTYQSAVDVAGYRGATMTPFEARYSLSFCVASTLLHGDLDRASFEGPSLRDPRVLGLADRVVARPADRFEAAYPRQRGAAVWLHLADGFVVEAVRTTRKGDPDDPLSDEELEAKFLSLVGGRVGLEQAAALSEALASINSCADLDTLPAPLGASGAPGTSGASGGPHVAGSAGAAGRPPRQLAGPP